MPFRLLFLKLIASLLQRVSETIAGGSLNGAIDYTYDPVGNRIQRASTVAAVPAATYAYDANDRLTADTYDGNGNTTASGAATYNYDFENHLMVQAGQTAVSIVYDGDGNRVAETVGGTTTKYLVDDRNLTGYAQVLEEVAGGGVQRVYTYGLNRISQSQASGTSFYGYDGHGSVRLLADTTGAVTDRYDYDAFGNIISQAGTTPNLYMYSGEQNDPNLGFYYLRARYLNVANGRFGSLDPRMGTTSDPRSLHTYLYAAGDPVNKVDPTGEQFDVISVMAAESIRTVLAQVQTIVGFSILDQVRYGGSAGIKSLALGVGTVAVAAIAVRVIGGLLREVPSEVSTARPWGVIAGGLSAEEAAQAVEVAKYRGGIFQGVPFGTFPGIDGYLDSIPVSLKRYFGTNPMGVAEALKLANDQLLSAAFQRGLEFEG